MIYVSEASLFSKVDQLSLEGYANLEHWVSELDEQLSAILLTRLRQTIDGWCIEFSRNESDDSRDMILAWEAKRKGDRYKDEKVS